MQRSEADFGCGRIQRLVATGAEYPREKRRLDFAQQHIAVGNGQRAALAVTGGAGIGAGGIRTDAHASAVEMQY